MYNAKEHNMQKAGFCVGALSAFVPMVFEKSHIDT